MKLLTRDAILTVNDLQHQDVPIPEWGGSIRVRAMTLSEQDEFGTRVSGADKTQLGAWLVSMLAIDEAGNRLFTEADVVALQKKSATAIGRVVNAILAINKVDEQKVEAAEKP